MKKIGTVCISLFAAFFLLAGCTRISFNDDHFRTYRRYLNYAFGDFELVEARRGSDLQGEPQFGMRWYRYRVWEIAYTRPDGEAGTFIFNNRGSMRGQVRAAAFAIAYADMADVIANYSNNFRIMGFADGNILAETRVTLGLDFVDINEVNILCSKMGLQLSTATTQSLMADWRLGLNHVDARQFATPTVTGAGNLLDIVRALSVYATEEGVLRFTLVLDIRSSYINSVTINGSYDSHNNILTINEVRGRTNLVRGYANASRDFLTIVRMLGEIVEQDKINVDFRFTFSGVVLETLSVDWAWFHAIEYFCVHTDSFIGEFEDETPAGSRRHWIYENFHHGRNG
ncbi:MAG: hypothetical protein FWC71_02975 [Defluviitaleaceae bacterium]|nr:hypothetical protein [Defluviitaleaceae bacterium]